MSRFKLGLTLGFGIGYVLGTKAGRERYLQLQRNMRRASELWQKASSSSLAQKAAHKAGEALGDGLESAKRTTFNAFYTSPVVIAAMLVTAAIIGFAMRH